MGPTPTTFSVTKNILKRHHSCGKKIKNTVRGDLTRHYPAIWSKALSANGKQKCFYLISKLPIPLFFLPESEAGLTSPSKAAHLLSSPHHPCPAGRTNPQPSSRSWIFLTPPVHRLGSTDASCASWSSITLFVNLKPRRVSCCWRSLCYQKTTSPKFMCDICWTQLTGVENSADSRWRGIPCFPGNKT